MVLQGIQHSFSVLGRSNVTLYQVNKASCLPLGCILFPFRCNVPSVFNVTTFQLSLPAVFPPQYPCVTPPRSSATSHFRGFSIFSSLNKRIPFNNPPAPLLLRTTIATLFSPSCRKSFILATNGLSQASWLATSLPFTKSVPASSTQANSIIVCPSVNI